MSSFVGRLARTLSQGSDGLTPRRSTSLDEESDTPRRVALHRLSASPSFNDFSLNAQEDAEEEYKAFAPDNVAPRLHDGEDPGQQRALQCHVPAAEVPARAGVLPPEATGTTTPRPIKSKSIKIMGMDPYDYCELLRSSCL